MVPVVDKFCGAGIASVPFVFSGMGTSVGGTTGERSGRRRLSSDLPVLFLGMATPIVAVDSLRGDETSSVDFG